MRRVQAENEVTRLQNALDSANERCNRIQADGNALAEQLHAWRQACPLCYCSECVAEQLDPAWQSIAIDSNEKMFFHTLRAFHLAGRCGDCQACSQACPVGVPLYLLNQKVAQEVARLFGGYEAGADPNANLPLTTFRRDEVLTQSGVCAANRQGLQEVRLS